MLTNLVQKKREKIGSRAYCFIFFVMRSSASLPLNFISCLIHLASFLAKIYRFFYKRINLRFSAIDSFIFNNIFYSKNIFTSHLVILYCCFNACSFNKFCYSFHNLNLAQNSILLVN